MTLPNNPFAAPAGVPQPSQEPVAASSLPAPTGAPVMVAPTAAAHGAAPLYSGAASSSRSLHGCIAAWMIIVLKGISTVDGFIPLQFDHLDVYVRAFSNPLFWFWRLMDIVVIALAVLSLRKGAVIARYVTACIIVVLFFIVTPVVLVAYDDPWYYAFIPNPDYFVMGAVGARFLLSLALQWICVIAAILLAIPDFKPAPSPYAMSAPVQMPTTQPAAPQWAPMQVQASSPVPAPPSGAPLVPGTPVDSAQASE